VIIPGNIDFQMPLSLFDCGSISAFYLTEIYGIKTE
jgi:hypothetical protein